MLFSSTTFLFAFLPIVLITYYIVPRITRNLVLFIFSLWQTIFLFAAILVIMFGLIMRVLKNVFEKAVEIKSENDFTI